MSLIFVALMAFLWAVNQKLQHHYSNSIFFGKKPEWFWNPVMWDKSPKIFNYRFDARHIAISLAVVFLCMGLYFTQKEFWQIRIGFLTYMIVGGTIWMLVFNLFFDKIFSKKK